MYASLPQCSNAAHTYAIASLVQKGIRSHLEAHHTKAARQSRNYANSGEFLFFFFFSHHFESSKRPLVAIFTALLLPSASKQNRRLDFFLIPAMPCLSMQPTNRHSMLSNVSSVSQLWYTWQKSFFEIMEICILKKTTSFMKQAQCNKEEKLTFQEFQTGLHHNSHPLCKENIL